MSSDKSAPPSIPPRPGTSRPETAESAMSGTAVPVFTPDRTTDQPTGPSSAKGAAEAIPAALPKPPATVAPTSTVPAAGLDGWPSASPAGGTGAPRTTEARTSTKVASAAAPRRVRLAVSRVDPWSVMKLSFLLSVAIGIMIVVATAVVWLTLDGMHVFTKVDSLVREVVGAESKLDILQYVKFGRVVSASALIAVVDVFLMTALSTIGAFLYNIVAALVGGIHLTMTDE